MDEPSPPAVRKTRSCQYDCEKPQSSDEMETIPRPMPKVRRSPIASTNFPEINPDPKRAKAKLEMMNPTWVALAWKVLAKSGIAGTIRP